MTPPAAAAAARTLQPRRTATPGRRVAPAPRPRRVSGPARGTRQRPARTAEGRQPLAVALPAAVGGLAGHRLLDRLIAGKAWIAVVAFALIGIVTLQLALLQLNTSIGRALERAGSLQRANAGLSIENSEMAAGDRVESRAAQLGMELVPAGALRFLGAHPRSDAAHAAAALSTTVQPSNTAAGEATSAAPATTANPQEANAGPASTAEHRATTGSQGEAAGAAASPPAAAAGSGEASQPAGSSAPTVASSESSRSQSQAAPAASAGGGAPASGGGPSAAEGTPAGGTQAGPAG